MFMFLSAFHLSIPYEMSRWQDLKDLFRREVGDVAFVEVNSFRVPSWAACQLNIFQLLAFQ